jgi:hypothetical protein
MVNMLFRAPYYELFPALCIGIWLGLQVEGGQARAMALGAQLSFFVGAGLMLFSKKGWWPVTVRLLDLAFWVVAGSVVALISYMLSAHAKRLCRRLGSRTRLLSGKDQIE